MSYVYWIRHTTHKDVHTEGYVGISYDPARRFWEHKMAAKKKPTNALHLAFLDVGAEEIEYEVIFSGSEEECAREEKRLRPSKKIGWNNATGGGYDKRTQKEKTQVKKLRNNLFFFPPKKL